MAICNYEYPPWITITGKDENGYLLDGLSYKIIRTICDNFNIKTQSFMGRDFTFGRTYENGTSDGMLGQLLDKEIDLILGPWVLDEARSLETKQTTVFYTAQIAVLASSGRSELSSFFGFLYTFDGQVNLIWYSLLAGFAALVTLSVAGDTLQDRRVSDRDTWTGDARRKTVQYFWMYLAALLSEGSMRNPSSPISKFVLALWLLSVMILTNGFTGQFKSVLMVRSKTDIIDTVAQLSARKNLVPYLPLDTIFLEVFQYSPLDDYKAIWKTALQYGDRSLLPPKRFVSPILYQDIKDGKGFAVADLAVVKSAMLTFCRNLTNERSFYFIKERFYPYYFIFPVRKDTSDSFLRELNKRILWLVEGDIVNRWMEILVQDFRKCEEEETSGTEETPLGMEHLLPLFQLLAFLLACCAVVFVGELTIFKPREKKDPLANKTCFK